MLKWWFFICILKGYKGEVVSFIGVGGRILEKGLKEEVILVVLGKIRGCLLDRKWGGAYVLKKILG